MAEKKFKQKTKMRMRINKQMCIWRRWKWFRGWTTLKSNLTARWMGCMEYWKIFWRGELKKNILMWMRNWCAKIKQLNQSCSPKKLNQTEESIIVGCNIQIGPRFSKKIKIVVGDGLCLWTNFDTNWRLRARGAGSEVVKVAFTWWGKRWLCY